MNVHTNGKVTTVLRRRCSRAFHRRYPSHPGRCNHPTSRLRGSESSSVESQSHHYVRMANKKLATYVEVGRSSVGVCSRSDRVHLDTNGSSSERVLVGRVPELPLVPDPIDHLNKARISPSLSIKPLIELTAWWRKNIGSVRGQVSNQPHERGEQRNPSYRSETTSVRGSIHWQ